LSAGAADRLSFGIEPRVFGRRRLDAQLLLDEVATGQGN
jgi:hypothetical protein